MLLSIFRWRLTLVLLATLLLLLVGLPQQQTQAFAEGINKVDLNRNPGPPPTVGWLKPVKDREVYRVATGVVEIELTAVDYSGTDIDYVHIYRWTKLNGIEMDDQEDHSPPYQFSVDVSTLPMGRNIFDVFAVDNTGQESNIKSIIIERVSMR